MISIAKRQVRAIRLPRFDLSWMFKAGQTRRRRATIDLIHASPHLLRDIGVMDGRISGRDR